MTSTKNVTAAELAAELPQVQSAVVFLDYDGTLTDYTVVPDEAKLSAEANAVLQRLTENPRIQVVLVSGRTRQFLAAETTSVQLDLAAEHGLIFKQRKGAAWEVLIDASAVDHLLRFRTTFVECVPKLPASFIEEKEFSLVWHYRGAPEGFEHEVEQCALKISQILPTELRLCRGNKILEIRPVSGGKGALVERYITELLARRRPELLLAIGDDSTDEEMFPVVGHHSGISVRVGPGETSAMYRLQSPDEVLKFLEMLPDTLLSEAKDV